MEVTKHDRNFFKGLVIGSLAGAVGGIVFAPKSGKELRSDIKGKAIRETKRFYSGVRAQAETVFENAKDIFGGRARSEVNFRDLEEPDEFRAEA